MTVQETFNLAVQRQQAGRPAEAQELLEQVLAQRPDHAGAWSRLGMIAHQLRRHDAAAEFMGRAVGLEPENPEYQFNLGLALAAQGRPAQAIAAYRKSLDLKSDSVTALCNLGVVLQQTGDVAEAIARFRRAIEINPNYADAHINLGSALRVIDDLDGALASCRRALELRPDDPAARNNLANALYASGDTAAAIAACRRGVAVRPDFALAHCSLGLFLLAQENFAEGWPEYEWRLKLLRPKNYQFTQPPWRGEELAGKRILLHAEQGFGDTIQFIRYLPLVAQRGGKITVVCQPELRALIGELPEIDRCLTLGQPLGEFDAHCPLPSLPWALNTTPATIPATVPYLSADPAVQSRWQARLPADGRLKIGLAWRGRLNPDPKRSMPLAALAPLAKIPNVRLISLQKGDRQATCPMDMTDWTNEIRDFGDTAGLIAALDLVISIDSAVAHLAGAMGKRVFTLVIPAPDWRWRLKGSDCAWYPTMRLFRQRRLGDWQSVVDQVVQALQTAPIHGR